MQASNSFSSTARGVVMEQVANARVRDFRLPFINGLSPSEVVVAERVYNPSLMRALDLARVLKERNHELYDQFAEINIHRDPSSQIDSLTAQLAGGTEVRFGDSNPIEKLPVLEYFIGMQRQQNIDPFAMAYVDLRFKNQIVSMDKETAWNLARSKYDVLQKQAEQAEQLTVPEAKSEPKSDATEKKPTRDETPSPRKSDKSERRATQAAQQERAEAAPQAQAPAAAVQQPAQPESRGVFGGGLFSGWRRQQAQPAWGAAAGSQAQGSFQNAQGSGAAAPAGWR